VHEQGAAHMADGHSRVSGRHGVVIDQKGQFIIVPNRSGGYLPHDILMSAESIAELLAALDI
jgi:hypothetical protein